MASIYENLKNDRPYSASTGLTLAKFNELYEEFQVHFIPQKTNVITGALPRFYDPREALFFVLFYLKTYPTLQVLGLIFGISDYSASDNFDYLMPFLKATLKKKEALVYRIFDNQEAFANAFKEVADIFVDGTAIGIARAKNDEIQQKSFSGKKNFIHSCCA
jgi:hypothetical protein